MTAHRGLYNSRGTVAPHSGSLELVGSGSSARSDSSHPETDARRSPQTAQPEHGASAGWRGCWRQRCAPMNPLLLMVTVPPGLEASPSP